MNKKALEQKPYVKYLGLLIDEHLNWREQVSATTIKLVEVLVSSANLDLV